MVSIQSQLGSHIWHFRMAINSFRPQMTLTLSNVKVIRTLIDFEVEYSTKTVRIERWVPIDIKQEVICGHSNGTQIVFRDPGLYTYKRVKGIRVIVGSKNMGCDIYPTRPGYRMVIIIYYCIYLSGQCCIFVFFKNKIEVKCQGQTGIVKSVIHLHIHLRVLRYYNYTKLCIRAKVWLVDPRRPSDYVETRKQVEPGADEGTPPVDQLHQARNQRLA